MEAKSSINQSITMHLLLPAFADYVLALDLDRLSSALQLSIARLMMVKLELVVVFLVAVSYVFTFNLFTAVN